MHRYHSWCGEDTPLSTSLVQFGRSLSEITSYHTILLTSLEGTFSTPLAEYVTSAVKPVEDVTKLLEAARTELDNAQSKYLRVRAPCFSCSGAARGVVELVVMLFEAHG